MKTAFALALVLIAAPRCPAQDQLADALRKAVVEEDVNHNLDAAIKAYQSIVERFRDDRTAAATAQFRLAECYRKLGKTAEADAAYNQLIVQFPDQTALVERSRRQHSARVTSSPQEALEREILQQKYDIAVKQLANARRRVELGIESSTEIEQAEMVVLRAQIAMLGTTPAARPQRRALLEQLIGLAQNAVAHEEKLHNLGVVSSQSVDRKKMELLDLQQELARL